MLKKVKTWFYINIRLYREGLKYKYTSFLFLSIQSKYLDIKSPHSFNTQHMAIVRRWVKGLKYGNRRN